MDDLMLPELPEPNIIYDDHSCDDLEYYTADQLREYAKKAVEADRAKQQTTPEQAEIRYYDGECARQNI